MAATRRVAGQERRGLLGALGRTRVDLDRGGHEHALRLQRRLRDARVQFLEHRALVQRMLVDHQDALAVLDHQVRAVHLHHAPGGAVELHDFYIPAGGDIADRAANPKFAHKLDFVAEATAWSARRHAAGGFRRAVLVGDLNIAPLEHDVWSHKQLLDVVSHTPVETAAMGAMMQAGAWHDALRHFVPADQKLYTWWSYRAADWRASDRGRRLDHVWVSPDLVGGLRSHAVLKDARGWEKASDHVPVLIEIAT
jgi:exodeoxyribonuclease III